MRVFNRVVFTRGLLKTVWGTVTLTMVNRSPRNPPTMAGNVEKHTVAHIVSIAHLVDMVMFKYKPAQNLSPNMCANGVFSSGAAPRSGWVGSGGFCCSFQVRFWRILAALPSLDLQAMLFVAGSKEQTQNICALCIMHFRLCHLTNF